MESLARLKQSRCRRVSTYNDILGRTWGRTWGQVTDILGRTTTYSDILGLTMTYFDTECTYTTYKDVVRRKVQLYDFQRRSQPIVN